jgi:hypothetical protein
MALDLFQTDPPKGDSMIHSYVITNFSGFANHHTHAVVYKKLPAYGCSGMYFYTCQKTPHVRKEPAQKIELARPEPVRDPVYPDRVKTGITEEYFENTSGSRISLENRLYILL